MGLASDRLRMHVERRDLYINLEARVRYLHSFLDFGSRDIEALISGAKYVRALIPAVVNIVYKKLLQYDVTARAFTTRSTSFEGPIDEYPNEDSPQIQHRKIFLRAYLAKLCSDPSQMEFWEYLDKVGMMHVGLGRAHPLHVEYIHLGVCLAFIQDIMSEAILSHPRLPMDRKIALVKALGKVIWIQNDLMAKWQVRDGAEFRDDDDEGTVVIEDEGYLHGKKILDDEEVPDIAVSSPTSASSPSASGDQKSAVKPLASPTRIPKSGAVGAGICPFSGAQLGAATSEK
ncbi:hypothetical protein GGTG_05293 [Gaeumannomyces tritici R3-111a-1]|uniref:Globin-sensor domain-containing protein n=1 Tax=Gaeumannomyces tritici (strain R3-111a-1) TaxID=644352 RepID=J3NVH8_GAET3|nr:hypothetical protein GGTG_05293 [Gaeumannomyces tritici R3-111a-1]EJT75356.1 hypothetical protein GGTG_05293 [Gaeumannomyces tritici R3-111a-1]